MTWGCLITEAAPSHYVTLLYIPAVFAKIPEKSPMHSDFFRNFEDGRMIFQKKFRYSRTFFWNFK